MHEFKPWSFAQISLSPLFQQCYQSTTQQHCKNPGSTRALPRKPQSYISSVQKQRGMQSAQTGFWGKESLFQQAPVSPVPQGLCWATLQVQLPQNFAAVTESCLKGDSSRGARTPLLPFQVRFPKPGWLSRAVLVLTHPEMSLTLIAPSICHGVP